MSSALSFYYAYDFCVFPGLYAEYSYLMKFLPFAITIALSIVVAAHRYRNECVMIMIQFYKCMPQVLLPFAQAAVVWLMVGDTSAVHPPGSHSNVYSSLP